VPLAAARRWLEGQPAPLLADVEGTHAQDQDDRGPRATRRARAVVRWRNGRPEVVTAWNIAPDDLLVVPATFGGIDPVSHTWAPESRADVEDLGDVAQWHERRRPVLRLASSYISAWGLAGAPKHNSEDSAQERKDALQGWLDDLDHVPERLRRVVEHFKKRNDWSARGDLALVARRRQEDAADASTEPDVSPFTEVVVTLDNHCRGVEQQAREFSARCGLPPDLVDDVALAARLHDLGKADPRFQAWLRNDVVPAETLLAKSSLAAHDRRQRRVARELSGYPEGGRHEMLSVALVDGSPLLHAAHDPELVLHLVASHHGFARPFAPFAPDDAPREVVLPYDGATLRASSAHGYERVGSPVPERFWRVLRRYGWYGLAWLEAILRLADHRRSEQEARGDQA
jgi:CRISPR-associated endonuclease/helicase Cas3